MARTIFHSYHTIGQQLYCCVAKLNIFVFIGFLLFAHMADAQ